MLYCSTCLYEVMYRLVTSFQALPLKLVSITFVVPLGSAGGGITNLLFKLDGPETENPVLVRIYGQDTEVLIDRERDNKLFNELAM